MSKAPSAQLGAGERTGRAIVLDELGSPQLREIAAPSLRDGEILLATRVSGLCGTDLHKLADPSALALSEGTVLGHELVGDVVESRHRDYAPGQRVVAPHHRECGLCELCRGGATTQCPVFRQNRLRPGGFSEWIAVDAAALQGCARKIPTDLSDERAVFLEPAACVLRGIDRASTRPGSRVAVMGAGSMGLLHGLVLRAAFADLSIAIVEPDEERRRFATRLGFAAPENLVEIGEPPEIVFDTVGGEGALRDAAASIRRGGRIVLFAHAESPAEVDLNRLFHREVSLVPTYSGSSREQQRIWEMLTEGRLDPSPLVTHRLPIESFAEGCRLARDRQALKVLFAFEH
ncbi:MAG: alcohol dehydrogenase catalytic domain-containing protein [Acidobacteriota bacterium]